MTTAMRELNYDNQLQKELTKTFFEVAGFIRMRA